ncbi:MAG TPA: hypothetical protein VNL17_14630 [Verrucomicrobiae bacterium]|nr:hypothetical protein [Verrucomicrobiae bacterium]
MNLYSHWTTLADVAPFHRGVTWREWQCWRVAQMATGWLALHAGENPLANRAIATKRDSYGWKSA